jgi:hypothetical protein
MFEKATKQKSKLRMALYGPSGSGKTYSALSIAAGLGKKIAVIDTEYGSASKYADLFDFDVCELPDTSVESYVTAMDYASDKYDVLIIDSLSHGWRALLNHVDKLTRSKYRGNSFSAWGDGTPLQKHFVTSLLSCKAHIIATMRAKTEWVTQTNDKGRSAPMRVGLAPEQGKGIEYEFDFLASITPEHTLFFEKSRAHDFQDKIIEKPTKLLGEELLGWLNAGVEPVEKITPEQKGELLKLIYRTGYQAKRDIDTLTEEEASKFILHLEEKSKELEEIEE